MPSFRPSVESLDDRALPSAVFATADYSAGLYATATPTADDSGETVVAKVRLSDILISSYSTKSSP